MATALTPLLGLGATATVRSSSFLGNTGEDWDILATLGTLWETLGHTGSDTGEDWDKLGSQGMLGRKLGGLVWTVEVHLDTLGHTGQHWEC